MVEAPVMFHPFDAETPDAWQPGNRAAELLLRVGIVGDDLARLLDIIRREKGAYDRKLIFKFFLVEFVSFMDRFKVLADFVVKVSTIEVSERAMFKLGIPVEARPGLRAALKRYHRARNSAIKKITAIRNNVGAHRSELEWSEMASLWRDLELELIRPVYDAARAAFAIIKDLPLYEWASFTSDGTFRFAQPLPVGIFEEPEILLHPPAFPADKKTRR